MTTGLEDVLVRNASATEVLAPEGQLRPGMVYEVPARQGRAFRLKAGQVARLTNHQGQQVGDFWAFSAEDRREFLSMEHMRPTLRKLTPRPGDALITNKRRALLEMLEDTSPGVHDTLIAACCQHRYTELGHPDPHDNCSDNLRMAMAAIGAPIGEIPCPFNLWMNTPPRADGGIDWLAPVSKPGDYVRLRAVRDAILVLSCCPMDLSPINGDAKSPKGLQVMIEG
ncbi:urea carboxylase-associated family protein [Xinfangfangia sp. CPCC 101601]|uniref:Urea carboxylase-associated family protein n=1 Tax=Pseudogemmobacter lacusdianii TaxID=3069608 RepID=A0ABU0VSW5_9RHOB|nr:urea carboxylase-associated family protein [Xinfangfangia sp. CPCC 101601]MDQ2064763.1 urea carboxylase-associated family protein [Xinfangfangia sp. CPCC 101601]